MVSRQPGYTRTDTLFTYTTLFLSNIFILRGLSGIAVPAGCRADGMPFGVTLAAPCFCDAALEPIAERLQYAAAGGMGRARDASLPTPAAPEAPAVEPRLNIAVVGAHLSGMALNRELLALGATLVGEARTAADYRDRKSPRLNSSH